MPIPILEMKLSGTPCAIIKAGDRQIKFVKIAKFGSKYFSTKDGQVFELDDEYEYRYKKTGVYFYNFSNSKPLSLSAMDEITEVLKREGDSELFNKQRFFTAIASDPKVDMTKLNLPDDLASKMHPDTRRFLQDHSTDDETAKTDLMIKVHTMKKPISKYSSGLIGIGRNRGSFAFVQVGYKRIDVCPMFVHDNRAYTKYGVFEIDRDSIYFFKKQMVCFFVVSNEHGPPAPPIHKKEQKIMRVMIKEKRWKDIDTFHRPIKKKSSWWHWFRKRRPDATEDAQECVPVVGEETDTIPSGQPDSIPHDSQGVTPEQGSSGNEAERPTEEGNTDSDNIRSDNGVRDSGEQYTGDSGSSGQIHEHTSEDSLHDGGGGQSQGIEDTQRDESDSTKESVEPAEPEPKPEPAKPDKPTNDDILRDLFGDT